MSKKQEILIVAWRDEENPDHGGAEVYITHMANALSRSGYSVKFLTSGFKGGKSSTVKNNVEYVRLGNIYTFFIFAPIFYLLHYWRRVDLVIETYNFVPFWIRIFEKRLVLVIYHIQSVEWTQLFPVMPKLLGSIGREFVRFFFPLIYKRSPVITISNSSKCEIIDFGFKPEKIEIVYPGINIRDKRDFQKPMDVVNIISLGRIQKTKNIDLMIDLISQVNLENNQISIVLDILGKGPLEQELMELVRDKYLIDFVNFRGYVSEDEKYELLRKSHLHLQLSGKEGWGMTIIEAALQGTPSMVFDVPGLRDSVNDRTGYIVKRPEMLNSAFRSVVDKIIDNDPGYLKKQKECIEWAKNFDWKVQEVSFVNFVKDLI
jgi:glycosyltransferase involved in cell wall biosynthesis